MCFVYILHKVTTTYCSATQALTHTLGNRRQSVHLDTAWGTEFLAMHGYQPQGETWSSPKITKDLQTTEIISSQEVVVSESGLYVIISFGLPPFPPNLHFSDSASKSPVFQARVGKCMAMWYLNITSYIVKFVSTLKCPLTLKTNTLTCFQVSSFKMDNPVLVLSVQNINWEKTKHLYI